MIFLQLITVLFAIACAWLNKWPVLLMWEHWPPGHRGEKAFHAANAVVKVSWCAVVACQLNGGLVYISLASLVLLLLQWLVFDITLNLFTGKPWHYLGQTAWLDKLVKNGRVKAAVVLALVIALNFLL